MDSPPVAVPHRRGRRVLLIPPVTGKSASWAVTLAGAADDQVCDQVSRTTWVTTRELDPDTATVTVGGVTLADLPPPEPDLLLEVRRPASYAGMRTYIGQLPVPTRRFRSRSVWFESRNELNHYRDLVLDGGVSELATQPMRLSWSLKDGLRHHYPDALSREEDGTLTLIDVTSASKLRDPRALAVFALTAATAHAAGWDYQLRTELPAQRVTNLAALRRHRLDPLTPEERQRLACLTFPCQAHTIVTTFGGGPDGLTCLWRLLATRALFTDLDHALQPDTPVHERPLTGKGKPPWLVPL